jgi:DNA-binding CsgD family transcriptional regulator
LHYAATDADRLGGLVLYGTSARNPPPWAIEKLRAALEGWGTGASIELFAPTLADDPVARSNRARLERASASPAMARAMVGALALIDVRSLLEQVRVPTLVLQRTDEFVPIDEARYLAAHIAGAELGELPGIDHTPWVGDSDAIVAVVERFMARNSLTPANVSSGRSSRRQGARPSAGWASLTEREQTVAALVSEGASNPDIARRLFISRQTVETHVTHIFSKLGVESRAAVVAEALKPRNT